jgi:hypothetical protein
MNTLLKITKLIGWVLLNLFIVILAFMWHTVYYEPLRERITENVTFTASTFGLYAIVFFIIIFPLFIIWLSKNPKRLAWCIPTVFLAWYVFFTGFLWLNERITLSEKVEKMHCLYCYEKELITGKVLRINFFGKKSLALKVEFPNIIPVDSVDALITKGLFGIETIQNQYGISECSHCPTDENEFRKLLYHRCFTKALEVLEEKVANCDYCEEEHKYLALLYHRNHQYTRADKHFLASIQSLLAQHFIITGSISEERTLDVIEDFENRESLREYFEDINIFAFLLLEQNIELRRRSLENRAG